MNVLRALLPCAVQRAGEPDDTDSTASGRSCWSAARVQANASRMTDRMGASTSSNLATIGVDPIQAARISSSNTEQLGIVIRCSIIQIYISLFCKISLAKTKKAKTKKFYKNPLASLQVKFKIKVQQRPWWRKYRSTT